MTVSVDMIRKPDPLEPSEYAVKAVVMVAPAVFQQIMRAPLQDRSFIAEHIKDMAFDEKTQKNGALVIHDGSSKDAILVHSSGYAYCRYAAYAPAFMTALEQEIRMELLDMVADEMNAHIYALESETPHQPSISWDKLGKRLGFAVSPESGLRSTVEETLAWFEGVEPTRATETGIEIDVDLSNLFVGEQVQQMGSIQL